MLVENLHYGWRYVVSQQKEVDYFASILSGVNRTLALHNFIYPMAKLIKKLFLVLC